MSGDIIAEAIRPFHILRPWDTILEEPQLRATTSNRLRLPPPTFAQQDRETRGPPKVIKSHDQHIRGDIHTSFTSFTASSHKLQHKHQYYPRFPMDVAIRCSAPNCSCDCFAPGKTQMRICANCNHGWISHAMDNLGFSHLFNSHTINENFQANSAFDIASLILYGTHALPVRLKILLDRVLLCTLDQDELLHLLHGFGWTYDDYTRGYKLQDSCGNSLSRWAIITREEESLVLQLFLRFSETKNIAQNFVLQDSSPFDQFLSNSAIFPNKRDSDIRKFIERTNKTIISSNIRQSTNSKHINHSDNDVNSTQSTANTGSVKSEDCQKQIGSSTSILQPISPNEKKMSLINSHSPSAMSPLNKLQNMQPFDYRKCDTTSKLPSIGADIPMTYAQSTTPTSSSPTTSSFSYLSSGLPLLSTNLGTNHVSSISTNMTSTTNSDMSATDGQSDEDTNMSGAINLSQTSSAYALKKVKHLRKSANPMKRRWNPMVLSGLTTNPSTGKKRVQCHVCLKTFCDKGALKIHFSAVHLREMHKCTVEGCNMMFSSRRSRNRHSANPNPKLHTPNFRRKVNPHDGRSANPYPLIPPTSTNSLLSLTGNSLLGQNIDSSGLLESEHINAEYGQISSKSGYNLDRDRDSISPVSSCLTPDPELSPLPTNKTIGSSEKVDDKSEYKAKNGPQEEGINLSLKDELASNKGVRKRKNLNPIKFAPMSINASDDDMRYITSDDSSSGTYIDRIDDDENVMLEDSKSDFDSSNDIVCDDSKGEELENSFFKEKRKKSEKECIQKEEIEYNIDGTIDLSKKRTSTPLSTEEKKQKIKSDSCFASKMSSAISATESVMENPLRHLESLSLGSFANLVNSRNQRSSMFSSNSVHSLSFQSPGLGFCVRPPTPPTLPISKTAEREHNSSIKESECGTLSGSSANAIPSGLDIDSCIADHVSLLPAFRDASFVGQVEVPVDKENPRRCTACGKIFQNHFGVKTHYQNVHLKLMHKCTVEGCNASFPSKRSRDRHSANLNLHRKLLSTHSDGKSGFSLDKSNPSAMFPFHPSSALRDDLFSRLYDPQGLPLSLGDLYSRLPPLGPDGLFAASAAAAAAATFPVVPGFHPALCLPPPPPPTSNSLYLDTRSSVSRESPNSIRTTPSPSLNSRLSPTKSYRISSPSGNLILEASFIADESGRYVCSFCQRSKSDANTLREHYERVHKDALLKCFVHGCNRAFLDKKTKKKHTHLHSPSNNRESRESPL